MAEPTGSNPVVEMSQWEGAKENILPLKKGRNVAQLARTFGTAISDDAADRTRVLA